MVEFFHYVSKYAEAFTKDFFFEGRDFDVCHFRTIIHLSANIIVDCFSLKINVHIAKINIFIFVLLATYNT